MIGEQGVQHERVRRRRRRPRTGRPPPGRRQRQVELQPAGHAVALLLGGRRAEHERAVPTKTTRASVKHHLVNIYQSWHSSARVNIQMHTKSIEEFLITRPCVTQIRRIHLFKHIRCAVESGYQRAFSLAPERRDDVM